MGAVLQRVQDLINLAVHETAAPEEARTSALAAVQMIRKYGLLLRDSPQSKAAGKSNGRSARDTVPPAEVPRADPEAGPVKRSRAELKARAEVKADRFVSFLVKKSIFGEFPFFTSVDLAKKSVKNGEVHTDNLSVFHYYLQLSLAARVKRGTLVSKSGGRGGYQLRRSV